MLERIALGEHEDCKKQADGQMERPMCSQDIITMIVSKGYNQD